MHSAAEQRNEMGDVLVLTLQQNLPGVIAFIQQQINDRETRQKALELLVISGIRVIKITELDPGCCEPLFIQEGLAGALGQVGMAAELPGHANDFLASRNGEVQVRTEAEGAMDLQRLSSPFKAGEI